MLGLELDAPRHDVMARLRAQAPEGAPDIVVFRDSPRLRVDNPRGNMLELRAIDMKHVTYAWHNLVATLRFESDRLASIRVMMPALDESFAYQGRMFGKIGLGSRVADLLEFCPLAYDNAEEWFYPTDEVDGLIVGSGVDDQDLAADPEQRIASIIVLKTAATSPGR